MAIAFIQVVESADWTATTGNKTASVTSCVAGDLLLLLGGGSQTAANPVTAALTTTTSGTTSAWTEPQEAIGGGDTCWATSAWATVSADGTITVQLGRTQTSGERWGFYVMHVRGAEIGTSGLSNTSATEVVSLTVLANSIVATIGVDWDIAAVPSGFDPASGANEVERQQTSDYTVAAAYWTGQSAGTRNYGSTGSSSTNFRVIAIEMKESGGGGGSPPLFVRPLTSGRRWR